MGGRQLPVLVQKVVDARRFQFYDYIIVTFPIQAGETEPLVIRAAKGSFEMETSESLVVFTMLSFLGALDRLPTPDEQDDWTEALGLLVDGPFAAFLDETTDLLESLFASAEYTARARTNGEYVNDLYSAYMNRNPDAPGLDFHTDALTLYSRAAVRANFAASDEFEARMLALTGPMKFEGDVKSFGPVTIAEGRSIANVDVELFNAGGAYSVLLNNPARLLYPSRAVMGRAFHTSDDQWYGDPLIVGWVQFGEITKTRVPMTIISDSDRRGAVVAESVGQRCGNLYKQAGCDTTDPSPTCSLLLNDAVNGCKSKIPAPMLVGATDNRPSFRGASPDLAEQSTRVVTGDDTPEDYDSGYIDPRRERIWARTTGRAYQLGVGIVE